MSALPSLVPVFDPAPRRNFPRYALKVPLDTITLRSGIPDSLPGRCTDLSEDGVGAMIAGELMVGQNVGVELRLPHVSVPLQVRALVRHQTGFRCGLQFVHFSLEQREMVRYWAHRAGNQPASQEMTAAPASAADQLEVSPLRRERSQPRIRARRWRFFVLLPLILSLALFSWWQWQRAWRDLETRVVEAEAPSAVQHVSASEMAGRIVFKVEPAYPEAARIAGSQGLVVLNVTIAADGTVQKVRSVSGPDLLVQAAMEAVRRWKFEPYRAGGEPVEVDTAIAVEFRLN